MTMGQATAKSLVRAAATTRDPKRRCFGAILERTIETKLIERVQFGSIRSARTSPTKHNYEVEQSYMNP